MQSRALGRMGEWPQTLKHTPYPKTHLLWFLRADRRGTKEAEQIKV